MYKVSLMKVTCVKFHSNLPGHNGLIVLIYVILMSYWWVTIKLHLIEAAKKMADILQNTFSNAFSWKKNVRITIKFYLRLFSRVQLTISQQGLGDGLLPKRWQAINSLAPGKFEWNFRHVIFKQILVIDGWGISCEIALSWKPQDLTDDKSTLVQVMAWCHQATSHYLSQCWPRSLSPYGVTWPQWVELSQWWHGSLMHICHQAAMS